MIELRVTDVNDALNTGVSEILQVGIHRNSRNGPVLEFPEPVTTTYLYPQQRVLFNEARNHNSIFAWAETLWMLAGRDDLGFLLPMNKNMASYSDDGKLVRGSAYGKRWRSWFGHDQLDSAISALRADKDTRRVVIQQWDARTDPVTTSKDIPCNTVIYPYIRPDSRKPSGYRLDLTVSCRSNDMIYGAYGSNAVHFSILQEIIASAVGVDIGLYHQVSNSLHIYTEFEVTKKVLNAHNGLFDTSYFNVSPRKLIADGETYEEFIQDVYSFFRLVDTFEEVTESKFGTSWFREVWVPIWSSFITWKYDASSPNRLANTLNEMSKCKAYDLKLDIERRYKRLSDSSQPSA